MTAASAIRLAHLSDVHVSAAPLGWRPGDWLSKRVTGWFNTHCMRRRHTFRQADAVLTVLAAELHARRPDCVVFSGDASMLGFASEVTRAATLLHVDRADQAGVAV